MKKLYATTSAHWPCLSPDGRFVVAGNGRLKLIDLQTVTEKPIATELKGFLRAGWWSSTEVLIQHDDGAVKGDGFLYLYTIPTATLTVFRNDGNYRGSVFRAWLGHWCVVQGRQAHLILDGVDFGPNYFNTDLSSTLCASNYNSESFLRLIDVRTRVVTDVVPKSAPHVVKVSRDYVACGYFGPSNLRLPDGRQGFVNITAGEGPARVVFAPNADPGPIGVAPVGIWVVTGAEVDGKAYCFCRPLGHTQPTAVVIPHPGNALSAVGVGTTFRVAADHTNGHMEVWEVGFTEALVPIPVKPPVPTPIPPQPPVVRARATIESYDKEVTLPGTCLAVARVTAGTPTGFKWQYEEDGAWETAATNPATDLDHRYVLPAGSYPIRLQTLMGDEVSDTSSSTSRVVTVLPAVPPVEPPEPPEGAPEYAGFVNIETPQVADLVEHTYGRPPTPGDMGHNSYRRLAQGWTARQVQQGIVDSGVNYNGPPWFGWVPVEYDPFVNIESYEVAVAYRTVQKRDPTPQEMGHTAWRRFAEFWTHRDILHDIHGEPLEDGGAGGATPELPPVVPVRTGLVRATGRRFYDDGGIFLPLGGTLFWAMRGWKHERDRVKQNIDWLGSKGFDYMRVLAQVGWKGNDISEEWPDHTAILGEVIDYAATRGLRTQVTGIGGGDYNGRKVIDSMIVAITTREPKVLYTEVVNEWYGNFDGSEEEMQQLGKRLKDRLPNLVALSAPKEELATQRAEPWIKGGYATMATVHLDRSDNTSDWKWRHVRKPWEPRNPAFPTSHGEPGGPLSSVASFMEPIHLVMSRAVGILCGMEAYCLHNGAGVSGQIDPAHQRPANLWEVPNIDQIMAVVRGLDLILPPAPSTGTATRTGLGSHPLTCDEFWPDGNEDHGVVRDYARTNGPNFWQCLQGIRKYVNVKANKNYTLTFVDPVTHTAHDVSIRGGQSLKVERGSVDSRGYGAWIVKGREA